MDKRLVPILLLNFVNVLGFAVMIPVLPYIVGDFGGNNITYGLLLAAYPAFQFLGAPVLGTLSDRYGRRPILLISQGGTLVSWFIFCAAYFVPSIRIGPYALPLLVIAGARVVDGITGGNFSVANAYVSDITHHEKRTSTYGLLGAVIGIGLIIGPLVGGFLQASSWGYLGVGLFSAVVSTVTLILMYRGLPESLSPEHRNHQLKFHILREINIFHKIGLYSNPAIKKLFFMRMFFALTFSSYTSTIVLFMRDILSLSSEKVGLLFLVLGSYFIFNQSVVVPKIAKKLGNFNAFLVGQLSMVAGLMSLTLVSETSFFLLAAYLINLGFSLSFPTFKTLITGLVDRKRQGEVTGLDESVLAGASAVAPLAASIIYEHTGHSAYVLFGLVALIPYVLFYLRYGKGPREAVGLNA